MLVPIELILQLVEDRQSTKLRKLQQGQGVGRWLLIYKKVLTEMAFGQEAGRSELFKRNSIPGRGNRLCNGPEAGRGKVGGRGGRGRGAGGANTGMGTVVIRLLSTLSPELQFCT